MAATLPGPWGNYNGKVVVHPPTPNKVAGGATKTAKPTKAGPKVFNPSDSSTWGAGLDSNQLSAIVKSQIADAINPQVTGLTQQQKTYDTQQQQGQQSLTAYYAALAKALGGEAPAVSGAYNSAAQAIGNVGQGLTGVAGQQFAAGNAADQAILQRGGQGQAADYMANQANPGASALNPFYSANTLSPAEGLAGTGAARATEAAAQPRIFANTGADALTTAIQKAAAGDQDFQQKIADIYTQVPALRDKILSTVQDYETQQRQLTDTETELGIKNQTADQTLAIKQDQFKLNVQKEQDNINKINAQLKNSALDRQQRAQLQGERITAQKQIARYKVEQAAAKKVTATPTSKAKWLKLADTFYNGVWPKQRWDANSQTYTDVPGTGTPGVDYPVALARLMAAGATRGQAISILNTYYAPGERGRGLPKGSGLNPKVAGPDGTTVG